MPVSTQTEIATVSAPEFEASIEAFAALLHACVLAGASINFVLPFTREESAAFWRGKVLPGVAAGTRLLLAARCGGRLVGSVQLDCDTPPNQPHRAEVAKLMVHPAFRRRGIARALMVELERIAMREGRSLITLDTRTGDMAEPLYASMGYETVGVIPGFCRDTVEERYDGTTVMYKTLPAAERGPAL